MAVRLERLPGRVFSGKQHPSPGARAVFFCYALPAPVAAHNGASADAAVWSEETGFTRWYLYDLATERITEEPTEILALVRSQPDTPRHRGLPDETLSDVRTRIERHIKNTYFKKVQAPVGVKATLKVWMEIS